MTTPSVYTSRSRANRRRFLLATGVAGLVLVGILIGRLVGGGPAAGSPPVAATGWPSSAAPPSSDPPSPSAQPTTATPTGVDAYQPIQAEAADALTGVDKQDTGDQGGGQNVAWIANGDSMRFDNINFGDTPATRFLARIASDVGDGVHGRMEIRLDSPDGPPVGTLPVERTGGWQSWINQVTDVSGVTGVHTVFLTFAADRDDDFVNLNYLKFEH
jgi:Carbohydrate binding module (family 6)